VLVTRHATSLQYDHAYYTRKCRRIFEYVSCPYAIETMWGIRCGRPRPRIEAWQQSVSGPASGLPHKWRTEVSCSAQQRRRNVPHAACNAISIRVPAADRPTDCPRMWRLPPTRLASLKSPQKSRSAARSRRRPTESPAPPPMPMPRRWQRQQCDDISSKNERQTIW
jgi:hypothetical protein